MQRGKERARFDIERLPRDLSDAARDAYAMIRLEKEGAQDQEIECSLQEISGHSP